MFNIFIYYDYFISCALITRCDCDRGLVRSTVVDKRIIIGLDYLIKTSIFTKGRD